MTVRTCFSLYVIRHLSVLYGFLPNPTQPPTEDAADNLIISLCSCMSGCKPKCGHWEIQALLRAALHHQTRADLNP